MLVVLSATFMLVDIFIAIIQVTVAAAFMQAGETFFRKYMGNNFFEAMQVGVSVAIMQVVFFTVHYAHDYLYCSYAGDCFCCSYVCDSFK